MKVDFSLKRMDRLMVSSNIRKMGHLELLYTCVANLAKEYSKTGAELPESMHHHIEAGNKNRMIYRNHSDETPEK